MSDTLAARLKDLRLKAGLSQYALADRLQENRQRLAAYEQGRFEPPLDLATRWAAACGANLQIVLATTPHELEAAVIHLLARSAPSHSARADNES